MFFGKNEFICPRDFYKLPLCKWEEPKLNSRSSCISIAIRENIARVIANDETLKSLSETHLGDKNIRLHRKYVLNLKLLTN